MNLLPMAITSWGDPADRATWSGTAKSLMEAIEARGIGVIPVDSRPPKPVLAMGKALYVLEGYGGEWRRGRLVVRAAGRIPTFRDLVRPMLNRDPCEATVRALSGLPGGELERHHVPA